MNLLAPDELLYFQTMGRIFAVTGLFESDDDANAWLKRHEDHSVICVHYGRIYTAVHGDEGQPVTPSHPHSQARVSA